MVGGVGGWFYLSKGGAFNGGSTSDGVPAAYAGTWTGNVIGGAISTSNGTVTITLTKGSSKGTFLESSCNGDLNLTEGSGSGINLDLASDPQCPTGTVNLQLGSGGTLTYQLRGGGDTSSGTLHKLKASE
jgi:hypothetical protein